MRDRHIYRSLSRRQGAACRNFGRRQGRHRLVHLLMLNVDAPTNDGALCDALVDTFVRLSNNLYRGDQP
ncbi:hypothetical protein SRM_02172 [Salinibacter ruber M8]|uniref:Uncharacterized protein n=1 Tax=Salinibacter ruber (strain M8) TaxID=761659 RepID=D5HAN8_SALRM|nr:hypothetical protein SRM_02172 [Salinibacter ruber M8]